MNENTNGNTKPLPRKSCSACRVTATTDKKPNTMGRLKMTPQDIRDMYSNLLAQEVRRRIRQKIAEDAAAVDQIIEQALSAPDDLPAAPMPDYNAPVAAINNPNDTW